MLGENGLPYWQALTSFLTGRIGRIELEALVGGWLGPEGKRLSQYIFFRLALSVDDGWDVDGSIRMDGQAGGARVVLCFSVR